MTRSDDKTDAGFLGRWSRLKQEAQRAPEEVQAAPETPPEAATAEEPPPPLPSLDDIIPGADVSAFFQKHVPDALRQSALRKLWVTDPDIKGFIEMADYQWDFNNPDSIPGWSSSLEGFDVKKLIGNMFQPAGEKKEHEALADTLDAEAEDSPVAPQNADNDIISEASAGEVAQDPASDGEIVALQNLQDKSEVYLPIRKKHGGALPR